MGRERAGRSRLLLRRGLLPRGRLLLRCLRFRLRAGGLTGAGDTSGTLTFAGRFSGRRFPAPPALPFRRGRENRAAFLERERPRVAVLRDLAVLLSVGDVRTVAAIQHPDPGLREIEDRPVRLELLLLVHELQRTLESDRVRVVLFLE